jgi:SAM-dependent methyltransferase
MNLGPHSLLDVVQGDIYRLPFLPGSFDLVYCLGVLQHTPDVRKAFMSLPPQVRSGGRLTVDVYPKLMLNLLWPKYWIRPITKRMSHNSLFRLVLWMVKYLLPVSLRIGRIPRIGRKLRYAIPVANHEPDWPLTPEQVREWAVLNTFDMLSPAHDHPQSSETLRRWFEDAKMTDIKLFRKGFFVGRAVKPSPAD